MERQKEKKQQQQRNINNIEQIDDINKLTPSNNCLLIANNEPDKILCDRFLFAEMFSYM